MPTNERRRILPTCLIGLAGFACAACCAIALLLAFGILGGAGWAAAGRIMPGIALALAAAAGFAWWWVTRRRGHADGCAGDGCSCGGDQSADHKPTVTSRKPSSMTVAPSAICDR